MAPRRPRGQFIASEDHPELATMSTPALVALREDIGAALGALGTRTRFLRAKQDHISSIIRKREKPGLKISDHAVVRWLERFGCLDVDGVREPL
jgi:hypothetical protein